MKKLIVFVNFILFVNFTQAQQKSFLDIPYIEVNGSADTLVTPNEIFISITISESDVKDKISLQEQERRMVAGLKSLGINTEKELTTSDIESNYRFYVLKQKDVLKTKSYSLKVNNAVLATRVFMKLEELGMANARVDRVSHSEMEKIRNTCRTNAVKNAYQKAISLTAPIKAAVGSPLHIVDYSSDNEPVYATATLKVRGAVMADAATEELPQIDFEKIRISMNVQVKFRID